VTGQRTRSDCEPEPAGHECGCQCHREIVFHVNLTCDCGGPVRPPRPKPCCPPPCPPPQPGVVDVPQPPPYHAPTSPDPTGGTGRPPKDDPGEVPWYRGQVAGIQRNGPTFGPRKNEYLPYLLIRTGPGDRGARDFGGTFWESPDIFVVPNQEAATAPLMPPTLGGLAAANVPNTLYAHVWNLGKAPAANVRVEFYWYNPTLGISFATRNLVEAAYVDLGNRFTLYPEWRPVQGPTGAYLSRGSHAIVRCPKTWVPEFLNDGHECLVVRAFDPILDSLPREQYAAAKSRMVAQRNIAVREAASPASLDLRVDLGYASEPGETEISVSVDPPSTMDWLKLYTGRNDPGYSAGTGAVVAGFLPPTIAGGRSLRLGDLPADCLPGLLSPREKFRRGCDPLSVSFHASADGLCSKQANVLRITQRFAGEVIGGYTVVLLKK